jgi:ankyrin repeat protein
VARDRDRNILNSDEEILKAAENGDLPDDFDYMAFNNCKDKWGETPAHLAARNGHLLDDFDYVASQGMTP